MRSSASTRRRPAPRHRKSALFDQLSERLGAIFERLSGRGRISEGDVNEALREVRVALLEADVSLAAAKAFVARVKERAVGAERSRIAHAGADDPQDRPRRAGRAARPPTARPSAPAILRRAAVGDHARRLARLGQDDAGRQTRAAFEGAGPALAAGRRRRLSSRGHRAAARRSANRSTSRSSNAAPSDPVDDRARRRRRSETPRAFDGDHRYRRTAADRRSADGRARAHQSGRAARKRFCSSPTR